MISLRLKTIITIVSAVLATFISTNSYALANTTQKTEQSATARSSAYTNLGGTVCKVIEEADEYVKGATYECPGIGGYKLHTYEFDLRADIGVVTPSGKEYALQLPSVINPDFSTLGSKAEWRVVRRGGKVIPKALIVRYIVEQWSDDGTKKKEIHHLAVAKIAENSVCVTNSISASRTMNLQARRAADASALKPCLFTTP
ncbi:MAG: hypothetical protein JWM56_1122 [Candidatus Peribacteria bacterium]|nr:hypothetical protein [Candidatus Peribacteria bacterium]